MLRFLRRQYATSFRSRHYVPKEKSPTLRPLEPHILSGRLKKLADKNQLDLAVAMLKNAPLAAQNTPVWNTLIWECSKARRFKLAYELFMKRRGFSPTTRTFQTMFSGLSRIEEWSAYQQQLKNARSLYTAYQRHVEDLKKRDPASPELAIDPLPAYVTILGNAGQYDELFALYYVAAKSSPPTKFLFTAILRALSSDISVEQNAKNAADAKVLWREAMKIPNLDVDAVMVTAAILALSRGHEPEKKFAFQLLREYFGLTLTGEPTASAKMPLSPPSLAVALSLCANSEKPEEAIHFFQQILKRPAVNGGADIVDRGHMDTVLRAIQTSGSARLALETLDWMLEQKSRGSNGAKLTPTRWTYMLVLLTCQQASDWSIATRVFNSMTGYHCHDFMDGAVASVPRLSRRADKFQPDAETMSCMLRVAHATGNGANMRQCLRLTAHLDSVDDGLFVRGTAHSPESMRSLKKWAFDVVKLSEAVVETVDFVAANSKSTDSAETARWAQLRRVAMGVLSQKPDSSKVPERVASKRTAKVPRETTERRPRPLTNYEQGFRS
ncbi:hypothetical protein C8F01DRAFT_1364648 [Mycena amicta]|nr:hypothetical protein C8F01DRAFT_1364648 [Mycena amicta]